jgi:hypothetical protein
MAENKIGDIYVEKAETVRAFWRPLDGSPYVLLAAMNLYVHESHPTIRELFVNLAAAVAVNLNRAAGQAITVQSVPPVQPAEAKIDRQKFPCWHCSDSRAVDARAHLRGFSDADLAAAMSPRGTPMFCCRIAPAGGLTTSG